MLCRAAFWYNMYQDGYEPVAKPLTVLVLSSLRDAFMRLLLLAVYLGIGHGKEGLCVGSVIIHRVMQSGHACTR